MKASGYTLIEVVIATALLALTLSAFAASFVQSRRSATVAENRMEALHSARQQMETLMTLSFAATQFNYGVHALTNGSYAVTSNAQYPATVKDIALSLRWVNTLGTITSTVSLSSSISSELHQ